MKTNEIRQFAAVEAQCHNWLVQQGCVRTPCGGQCTAEMPVTPRWVGKVEGAGR